MCCCYFRLAAIDVSVAAAVVVAATIVAADVSFSDVVAAAVFVADVVFAAADVVASGRTQMSVRTSSSLALRRRINLSARMGKIGMSVLVPRRRTSPFSFSASSKEYTDEHLGAKKDVLLGAEEEDDCVDEHNKIISAKEELLAGLGRPGAAASCEQALGYPGTAAVHGRTGRSWE